MTNLLILFEKIAFQSKIIETLVYAMMKIREFLCVEAADEYFVCCGISFLFEVLPSIAISVSFY